MKARKIEITYKLTTSKLVLLNILQPTVVNMMTAILSCKDINGISYLTNDLYFECYDERNVFFSLVFAVPSLAFWVLIYPLSNLARLRRNKHFLNKIEVRKKYGFLYNSYRIQYYYFDCFDIYKKYLLILVINYWQTTAGTKSLIILLILGASSYYLATKNPYLTQDVSRLAFLADIVSLTTLFFGLLSFTAKDQFFVILGDVIALVLNILFLGIFAIKMIIIYKHKILKLASTSPTVKNILNKFFDNFGKTATYFEKRFSRTKVLNTTKKMLIR